MSSVLLQKGRMSRREGIPETRNHSSIALQLYNGPADPNISLECSASALEIPAALPTIRSSGHHCCCCLAVAAAVALVGGQREAGTRTRAGIGQKGQGNSPRASLKGSGSRWGTQRCQERLKH